ncbi:hypothetical protein SADUNF_Sadunf18G0048500 [Salix dunnii]|uniref:Uncharacterized protein n=1 Tax=Salix dunnii TaxID=1413687 RepID=A0A835MDG3_9ROSI|nr:hypothetical protein SADUNF_Sadunf18G0048500 [Salix dunnii]
MSGSPKAPQTCTRTLTRTRTSTASVRQKMESKLMEIVEQQEKNNVRKTPATQSSRRMAPAVAARGKVEAQNEHKSVQGVYKSRSAMGLKEKERVRPLKMDGPCWVIEDVETKDESGLGLKEKERVRPLKMDGPCWEIEDVEMKDENGKSGGLTDEHLLGEKRETNNELEDLDRPGVFHEKRARRNAAEFSYCKSIKKRRSIMNNLSTTDAGKLRMLKRRMRVFLICVRPHHSHLQSPSDVPLQVVSSLETQLACQVRPDPAHQLKLTWAKLARTRRGKVAKMRRETLHSTMKATMNEVRREFMNIKRELQEESLSNRYELEDYNPQQEMGSKKDLYSEVLSLDNASEINNELEKDEKSNDYEMDSYNPALEGLNG